MYRMKLKRVVLEMGILHCSVLRNLLIFENAGTSSMVAAICYAWLLENKLRQTNVETGRECLVVPVMNMQRGKMWNQRQVAWLFYHLGLDASSILFTDEVLFPLTILLSCLMNS